MKSDILPPAQMGAPTADEFAKNITGIGPTTEARLHTSGIRAFAQLAEMSVNELLELVQDLPGMSLERLANWDWPGHARQLAAQSATVEAATGASGSGNRQHYANFYVELLLDEENNVRRTRVRHIETKREAKPWPGWDGGRLLSFIQDAALQTAPQDNDDAGQKAPAMPNPRATPTLEITKVEVYTADSLVESRIVALDQAWSMRFEWILSDAAPDMLTGHWMVRTLLESIGPGEEYSLPPSGSVTIPLSDYEEANNGDHRYLYRHELDVAAGEVAQGTYELAVSVVWEREDGTPAGLIHSFSDLLQVYPMG